MIELGLVGYPLGHSLSPGIHAAALESCGLDGRYSLFPIRPEDQDGLKDLLERVRAGKIAGLNVTIPHKQNVIHFLDELTPTATAIGAVNTIYLRKGKLTGDNTDASGFLHDLNKFLTPVPGGDDKSRRHGDTTAFVLGAGGSARAVVYALVNDGWQITLTARRLEQAQELAASLTNYQLPITIHSLSELGAPPTNLQSLLSNLSLIVNTTPVGMTPHIDQSAWPENLPFPPGAVIYDLVYNPRQTKLVREACQQGLPGTTGLGMLVEQAALSFEIWTGCHPPREALFEAISQTAP
jgi:shikimate dehydrogenase